jgi:hypothetical protein
MVDPQFAPGEREELLALTHALFESLPSETAEITLRVYMRSLWPHLGREHLPCVLQIALEQSRWRR